MGYLRECCHIYCYVNNSPVSLFDPIGYQAIGGGGGGGGVSDVFDTQWMSWRYVWIVEGTISYKEPTRHYIKVIEKEATNRDCKSPVPVYYYWFNGIDPDFVINYTDEETGWWDPNPNADVEGAGRIFYWLLERFRIGRKPGGLKLPGQYGWEYHGSVSVPPCTKTTFEVYQLVVEYEVDIYAKLYHYARWGSPGDLMGGELGVKAWVYHGRYEGHGKLTVKTDNLVLFRKDEKLPDCCCPD